MKWLITGVAGFVGQHLARFLLDAGHEVHGTYFLEEELEKFALASELGQLRKLDVRDEAAVRDCFTAEKYDYAVHLAAQSSVRQSFFAPGDTLKTNLLGTLNILQALRNASRNTRLVFASSAEVYGAVSQHDLPLKEERPARPREPYGISKLAGELLCESYVRAFGLEVAISRAFNHTGPGQSPVFVVPDFAKQIAEIEAGFRDPEIRVGNIRVRRDFLDVRDVVRAYVLLAEKGKPGEVYNVASGVSYSLEFILSELLALSKVEIEVRVDRDKFRPVDVPVLQGDATKIRNELGWQPQIPIQQTLRDVLDYWRERIGKK